MSDAPLDRDQVLDELEQLATVEHTLIVEYLSVHCALGHDLGAEEGGATTERGARRPRSRPVSRKVRCSA